MLGQKDDNSYVHMNPNGRDIPFNIAEMLRQNGGNPYLSPHGRGFAIPQVENPSHIPPQGRASLPITNSTSGPGAYNNVVTSYETYNPDEDCSEDDSEQENDLKQKNNGNILKNNFQPHLNKMPPVHSSACNWNKPGPGMSDDDNNRLDETDYDEVDDEESDDDDEGESHQVVTPRNPTRRRSDICRKVLDVQSFQNREFEIPVSVESTPNSAYKNSKSALRRLGQRSFSISKLSLLFRRNKTENVTTDSTDNTSPDLQSSTTLPTSTQSVEDPDSKSDDTNQSPTVDMQKETLESLYFRSIFPEHFLTIQLFQLNVEEVQNIIRQVDHFKKVEGKLVELVSEESLSGPALMCCNLIELKKVLDLNLGNWTIVEQLITGLRRIQNAELERLTLQK